MPKISMPEFINFLDKSIEPPSYWGSCTYMYSCTLQYKYFRLVKGTAVIMVAGFFEHHRSAGVRSLDSGYVDREISMHMIESAAYIRLLGCGSRMNAHTTRGGGGGVRSVSHKT